MALTYNTKDLIETDSCPDPRLMLPDLLKKVGKIARLKICESERDTREYIDSEVDGLKKVIETIGGGLSTDTLDKLNKVAELFKEIDKNSDGSLSELSDILTKVTENSTNIEVIRNSITRIDKEIIITSNKIDNLLNRVDVLEQDSHTHEVSQREMVCQLSKNMIQAFNTGLVKFEEEMNKSCDVALGSLLSTNDANNSTTSDSSTETTTSGTTTTTTTTTGGTTTTSGSSTETTNTNPII